MADLRDGAPGGKPNLSGLIGKTGHQAETGDKTHQGNAHEQQAVTEKLQADASTKTQEANNGQGNGKTDRPAEKTAPPAGGALASGQGNLNAEGNNLKSQEAKPVAPGALENKALSAAQQPAAATDKTSPVVGKSQAEQVHAPGQNKELIATNPYNAPTKGETSIQPQTQAKSVEANQNPQSHHYEGKDQAGTSALPLVRSDRNTTDSPQAKANSTPTEKPIGGDAREHKDSQAPPIAKAQQENTSQNQNQNQKLTNYETKPEPKSSSIPLAVPIPSDIHSAQKNQNPVSTAHQPEAPPVAAQKDLAAKPADPNVRAVDAPKPITNDGKVASEAVKDPKSESHRLPELAGAGGEKNSAGNGHIAHEPPVTKESHNPNGGTSKQFDVAQEATTTEARGDRIQSQSQVKTSEDIATGRLDTTLTEKNRDHQVENTILPTGKNTVGEPSVKVDTGKTDKQEKTPEVDSVTGDKPPLKVPVTDAAAGGSALAIPTDHRSDKVTAGEPVERIILKVENGVFNLAEKGTVSKLLGVLEQIKTGKVTAIDPESTAFAHAVLSVKDANWVKVEVALKALDSSLLNSLLVDKLPPEQAENQKLARWELPKEREKSSKLEAENQELKRDRNFLYGFIDSIKGLFADFVQGRKPLAPDASAPEIVEDITIDAKNKDAVEQFLSKTLPLLTKYEAGEDADQIDVDDAPVDISSSKSIQPTITTRNTHVVETLSNCEEIALLKLGNSALSDLLAQINQIESTLIDGRPTRRDLLPGEVLFLPTQQEIQAVLDSLNPGAAL